MKRTRNMVYTPSEESRELKLFADNDSAVHERMKYVVESLKKHAKRGKYDADKAVDAWYYVSDYASKRYYIEFGYKFTVTERFTVAVEFEEEWREEILN